MIYVTTNPSVYARWGSASISIVSNNGFEIHFYLLIETDIEPDFDVFHALFELNVNESKYRFFWQEGIVGIAYVMDYMDNPYILEREILENLDTLSLAALHTHDMFKREYVESMGQHNLFRFIASSPDDELRKKEVPIKLEEYNLSYEKLERHYIEYYLINPTNIMQAHNIELIVDIIDSSEYAFVFKTKIDFMGDYSFEDRCIAGHRFSEAYPRYTFLFDNDYIIMRYTVSLRCYDKSLFEKIVKLEYQPR